LVLDEGSFQTRPAKIRRLEADATYIQATEGAEDVTMGPGPALLALAATSAAHADQIELLDSGLVGVEASMQTKVEEETFDTVIAQLEAADVALQAAMATKANQSVLDVVFEGLQTTSAQAANNGMNIQTLQGATSGLLQAVGELDARVTANAAASTATQGALNSTDQALAALTVEVASKQAQLGTGIVQGGIPLLEDGSIKAILGTAPVRVTAEASHVEVTMDDSYFAAITAIADATAAKQDRLTMGSVQGGRLLFDPNTNVIRAIKGIGPVGVAIDVNHVEVTLDQSGLASTSELLGVKSIAESNNQALADLMPQVEANIQALTTLAPQVVGKQAQLSAGDGMVFHEKLLEGAKVKSLAAGTNVTLESTDDFVTISAQTPPQVVAPFSIMGPSMMAVRARDSATPRQRFSLNSR
jgi:hypothetical protein